MQKNKNADRGDESFYLTLDMTLSYESASPGNTFALPNALPKRCRTALPPACADMP